MKTGVLVAGIGNVFLSDDGFGVALANRLLGAELPPGVEVRDIGIRGMHLAYRLLDGYRVLLLLDTAQRGGRPGALYLLEHDLDQPASPDSLGFNAHGMDPASVLALLDELAAGTGLDRPIERALVFACEPENLAEGFELSEPVAAAVDRAVPILLDLLKELVQHPGGTDHDKTAVRSGPGRGGGAGRQLVT